MDEIPLSHELVDRDDASVDSFVETIEVPLNITTTYILSKSLDLMICKLHKRKELPFIKHIFDNQQVILFVNKKYFNKIKSLKKKIKDCYFFAVDIENMSEQETMVTRMMLMNNPVYFNFSSDTQKIHSYLRNMNISECYEFIFTRNFNIKCENLFIDSDFKEYKVGWNDDYLWAVRKDDSYVIIDDNKIHLLSETSKPNKIPEFKLKYLHKNGSSTNLLIGRRGAGKTILLSNMCRYLLENRNIYKVYYLGNKNMVEKDKIENYDTSDEQILKLIEEALNEAKILKKNNENKEIIFIMDNVLNSRSIFRNDTIAKFIFNAHYYNINLFVIIQYPLTIE